MMWRVIALLFVLLLVCTAIAGIWACGAAYTILTGGTP
jgi:hypothetical protein